LQAEEEEASRYVCVKGQCTSAQWSC
jgi:hypothetical protein